MPVQGWVRAFSDDGGDAELTLVPAAQGTHFVGDTSSSSAAQSLMTLWDMRTQSFASKRRWFSEQTATLRLMVMQSWADRRRVEVSRTACFDSALAAMGGWSPEEWRQPLDLFFAGEVGIDEGGVSREFFR